MHAPLHREAQKLRSPGAESQDSLRAQGRGWPRRGRPLPPVPSRLVGLPWVPGDHTRESSAWKLEERRPLGLPRVSMETCVLHVTPLLPPDGCWYLEPRPKMLFRFQRLHFRLSSACTWEKGGWSNLRHC